MAHKNACARHHFLQPSRDLPNALHPVVNEINLSATIQFLLNRRLNQLVLPTCNHSLNGDAVFWRCLDHAHIAQPNQRHVQGARDRRGRHRENVHLFAHLLQPFLMADAKALFFIHHQQSEICELHVLRK